MPLDKEMEMITQGLKIFKEMKDFEKLLKAPLPPRFKKLMPWNSIKGYHAETFRLQGNDLFTKSGHDVCVHYNIISKYNQSIAMSPPKSKALALAYGNRSAILEHLGKYKECIAAIDRAVRVADAPALLVKLHCRKAKCIAALDLPNADKELKLAKFWLEKIFAEEKIYETLTNLMSKIETFMKNRLQNPVKMEDEREESLKLLSEVKAESANPVKIAYSKKYGRHLIATREIKPGEILVMEKTLNSPPDQDQATLYCWHCSSFLWDIIPCDYCITSCFCSERCKTESWKKYHEAECKIRATLFIVHNYLTTSCESLIKLGSAGLNDFGLRIFLTAIKQAGSVRNLKAALESFDKRKDPEKILKLPENDYRQIYALSIYLKTNVLSSIAKDSALKLIVLAHSTSIFHEIFDPSDFSIDKMLDNDDILYMGALLLKFCAVVDTYSIENYRIPDCKKENRCGDFGCGSISQSFGFKTSLTGRSCVPNAKRCMIANDQMILYSIMPIKKGAQIFDSPVSVFDNIPKLARQEYFQQCHGYPCDCRACKEDWPEINYEDHDLQEHLGVIPNPSPKVCHIFNVLFNELDAISTKKGATALLETMSTCSKIIEDSLEESPLPSQFSSIVIRGFTHSMVKSRAFPNMIQITDECHT